MAQALRWIGQGQPLPRRYELLPDIGIRVTHDFELPTKVNIYVFKAGSVYTPPSVPFARLARLCAQGDSNLERVRLVLDLAPESAPAPAPEALSRIQRGRGRPPSPHSSDRIPNFVEQLRNLSLPLANRWKKKLAAKHIYGSAEWLKWHNSSSRSTFYRLLDAHGVQWEDFKRSLLSQISQ